LEGLFLQPNGEFAIAQLSGAKVHHEDSKAHAAWQRVSHGIETSKLDRLSRVYYRVWTTQKKPLPRQPQSSLTVFPALVRSVQPG
jgi:hypothetical protein